MADIIVVKAKINEIKGRFSHLMTGISQTHNKFPLKQYHTKVTYFSKSHFIVSTAITVDGIAWL